MLELTEKEHKARKKVCLPLDGLESMGDLRSRVSELSPVVGLFKIGYETFTNFGPEAIECVRDQGADVFLDLKYKDIPYTIRGAAKAATRHGVYMFNVHAFGGLDMMKAAVEGAYDGAVKYDEIIPVITAVTVLTSLDKKSLNEQLRVPGEVERQVLHFAQLADLAGLDGIVCSAADLKSVKDNMRDDFVYVTPGIKHPKTALVGSDQKRVFTPGNAIEDGSSILVVGRAITSGKTSEERINNGYEIIKDMASYMN